ncbi:MAG: adenylate/guanylate cyclase domain-containing protein [Bacteroidia bacterium]|nr:adenylate/guanylate cyclase domain-containing protein [Bacteroidia bacterium]
MSEEHKLAIILFADIAGYTALMEEDETTALIVLGRFKEVIEREAFGYNGQLVQYFGDGALLTFDSSSKAVACAAAVQQSFREEPHVPVRMGMHMGDVLFKNGNVFGNGVNVASRIESLGVPGAVLMSKAIRDQIKNKGDYQISSLGSFAFKNVEEPVEVFALADPGFVIPLRSEMQGKLKQSVSPGLSMKRVLPIIAFLILGGIGWGIWMNQSNARNVLPEEVRQEKVAVAVFNNFTNDPHLDALGNMASDWISLGLRELDIQTTSPEMMRKYKDQVGVLPGNPGGEVSLWELTAAQYVVTGSYYRKGDSLQVTSRLESTKNGENIYDFPAIWGHINQKEQLITDIREKLKGYWTLKEADKLSLINPPKYEAYQAYLKCHMLDLGCFNKVLALDSTFLLARVYQAFGLYNYEDAPGYNTARQYIKQHWRRCTEFERNFFLFTERYKEGNYPGALEAIRKNYELDPSDLTMRHHLAYTYLDLNQPAKTAELFGPIFSQYDIYGDRLTWQSHDAYFYALNRLGRQKEVIALAEKVAKNFDDNTQFIRAYMLEGDVETLLQRLPDMSFHIYFAQMFSAIFPPETDNIYLPYLRDDLASFEDPEKSTGYLIWSHVHMYNWDSKAYAYYLLKEWEKTEQILMGLKNKSWREFSRGVLTGNATTLENNVSWHMNIWVEGLLGAALARQGKREAAYAQIKTLEAMRPGYPPESQRLHRGTISYWQGRIYALLGDKEQAVAALTRSRDEGRTIDYGSFVYDWDLASLKGYTPYEELVRPQ